MLKFFKCKNIGLGDFAQDVITEFEGTIIGKCEYLFGCTQYGLAPKVKDGKTSDTCWFDEGRIRVIGKTVDKSDVTTEKNGGVNRDAPK